MDKSELEFQKRILKEFDKYDENLWEKMPPARFSFWVKRKLWSTVEFAYLLKGKEPLEKDTDKIDYLPSSFITYFEDLIGFMRDGVILGSLKPIYPYTEATILDYVLHPRDWLDWAKKEEVTIPDELTELLKDLGEKIEAQEVIDMRERNTFLRIIAVLAKESGLKLDNPFADAETLLAMGETHQIKLPKKSDTIASKLKEARRLIKSQ